MGSEGLEALRQSVQVVVTHHAVALVLTLVAIIFGLILLLLWTRGRAARRVLFHQRLGEAGERKALKILKQAGYQILDCQTTESYQFRVDGQSRTVHLRADFLVKKGARTYVAEAKSGSAAASVAVRATRRQLLEYLYAFDVSGVLLVDVTQGAVHEVVFPVRRS